MIRKILHVTIIMMLFFAVAVADINYTELDSLSDYELFKLQAEIQDRIYKIDESAKCFLFPGVYIVGETIESGEYIIKAIDPTIDSQGVPPYITIWKSRDVIGSLEKSDRIDEEDFRDKDNMYQCNLIDGMAFKLNIGVFQFIKR